MKNLLLLLMAIMFISSCTKEEEVVTDEFGDLTYLQGDWVIRAWHTDFDGNVAPLKVYFDIDTRKASIYETPDNAVDYKDGDFIFQSIKQKNETTWEALTQVRNIRKESKFIKGTISKINENTMESTCTGCGTLIFTRL